MDYIAINSLIKVFIRFGIRSKFCLRFKTRCFFLARKLTCGDGLAPTIQCALNIDKNRKYELDYICCCHVSVQCQINNNILDKDRDVWWCRPVYIIVLSSFLFEFYHLCIALYSFIMETWIMPLSPARSKHLHNSSTRVRSFSLNKCCRKKAVCMR